MSTHTTRQPVDRTTTDPDPNQMQTRRRRPDAATQPEPARVEKPLLNIEETAELLNTTPRFVRRLVHERRVPYLKVGRFIRFDPAEIDAWLDGCRRTHLY